MGNSDKLNEQPAINGIGENKVLVEQQIQDEYKKDDEILQALKKQNRGSGPEKRVSEHDDPIDNKGSAQQMVDSLFDAALKAKKAAEEALARGDTTKYTEKIEEYEDYMKQIRNDTLLI